MEAWHTQPQLADEREPTGLGLWYDGGGGLARARRHSRCGSVGHKRCLFLRNDRRSRGHFCVQCNKVVPLRRYFFIVKNSVYRTFGCALKTVNARFRVDVDHLLALVKTFRRADNHAIGILAAEARSCHYMRHTFPFLQTFRAGGYIRIRNGIGQKKLGNSLPGSHS